MEDHMKIAVVTGGGSGIGRASALALAHEGFAVVVAGRRKEALDETSAEARAMGSDITVVPTDVTDPRSIESLFSKVRERFGRIDLLFNNAGVGVPNVTLEELTFDQWSTVIATNLTGAFLCTQQAFRLMQEQQPQGGRIINNGSLSAYVPRPHSAPYTAAKHGITGLTRATSLDGRRYNIACGQIDIGNAATDIAARITQGIEQADGTVMREPTIDVEHVAKGLIYMAGLPLDANVQFLTIMATKMPFVGRG
jgi:NAD(P)-dependent dehydrogenase (short-subunit alcohol dehydrogenase family)